MTDTPEPEQPRPGGAPGDHDGAGDRQSAQPTPEPGSDAAGSPPPGSEPPPGTTPGTMPPYGTPAPPTPPAGYPPIPPTGPSGYPPAGGGYQAPGYPPPGYPQSGYPQSGYPQQGANPNLPPANAGGVNGMIASFGGRTNMLGILSAAAGILSVVCCACASFGGGGYFLSTLVLSVPAIVLGVLHLQKVRAGQATKKNLAIIGIVLGALGLLIAFCAAFSHFGSDVNNDVH